MNQTRDMTSFKSDVSSLTTEQISYFILDP